MKYVILLYESYKSGIPHGSYLSEFPGDFLVEIHRVSSRNALKIQIPLKISWGESIDNFFKITYGKQLEEFS